MVNLWQITGNKKNNEQEEKGLPCLDKTEQSREYQRFWVKTDQK